MCPVIRPDWFENLLDNLTIKPEFVKNPFKQNECVFTFAYLAYYKDCKINFFV